MAHNIFEKRIFLYREPAWHRLREPFQTPHTAIEAGQVIGIPEVDEAPCYAEVGGVYIPVPSHKAIFGTIDGVRTPYTLVSQDYQALHHTWFVEMADQATNSHHVETMGLLGQGEKLWLAYEVERFDVRGDETRQYLLLLNALDGITSSQGRLTSVRTVCANTLNAGLREATSAEMAFNHRSAENVKRTFAHWVRATWANTHGMSQLLREAYDGMAACRVAPDTALDVMSAVFPLPTKPADRLQHDAWDHACKLTEYHRDTTMLLWHESPTRTTATDGTVWGLYNAVAEYEQHARGVHPRSSLFGAGAHRLQVAFDACVALV